MNTKTVCQICGRLLAGQRSAQIVSWGLCQPDFLQVMGVIDAIKARALGVLAILLIALPVNATAAEIDSRLAVRAIVGEAANQGERGMLAVAGAIRNRGTLRGVYGVKNPIADRQPAWVWARAEKAWRESATNDVTHGATHWENCRAFGTPAWARSMTVTATIKDHTFFK